MFKNSRMYFLALLLAPALSSAAQDDSLTDSNQSDWGTTYLDAPGVERQLVVYQKINGYAVFQGDIILGTVAEAERKLTAIPETDTTINPTSLYLTKGKWTMNTIPYQIAITDVNLKASIDSAIATWNSSNPNVQLVERTPLNAKTYTNFVEFTFTTNKRYCASQVGMLGIGSQNIILATDCDTVTIIHEIGHTAGLQHEQSRSDRNKYIKIIYANIGSNLAQFDKITLNVNKSQTYDFSSIMHYNEFAFGKPNPLYGPNNPTEPMLLKTIEPLPKYAGTTLGNTTGLTQGDINAINIMYPKIVAP